MKYMILPAKKLQCGDVVFTNNNGEVPQEDSGEKKGTPFCARVIGQNFPHPNPAVSEYRVEVIVGDEEHEEGSHTVIGFRHETALGVAREDDYASVDVAALLDELDGK